MFENRVIKYNYVNKVDVFSAKFIFYFFKAFGIATIDYDHVWDSEKKSWTLVFKTSRIGVIYNVACICLWIPININCIIFFYNNKILSERHQVVLLYTVAGSFFCVSLVFLLFVFIFQQTKLACFANKIFSLRNMTAHNYPPNKRFFSFFFVNYLITFTLFIAVFFYKKNVPILCSVGLYVSVNEVFFLLIQYTLILKMIKGFFQSINNDLNKLLLKEPICIIGKFNPDSIKIDKLMRFYSCLYDLSRDISSFYSLPMFWAVFNIFVILLTAIHLVIVEKIFVTNNNLREIALICLVVVYLSIISFSTLVVLVTNTIKEVNFFSLFNILII